MEQNKHTLGSAATSDFQSSNDPSDAVEARPALSPSADIVLGCIFAPPTCSMGDEVEKIVTRRTVMDSSGFEYLVKFRGKSHLHDQWLSPAAIIRLDPKNKVKLKKFVKDWLGRGEPDLGDGGVDPAFIEVDRVLASEVRDGVTVYLVKWAGLSHTECTWESGPDLEGDEKVAQFWARAAAYRERCVLIGDTAEFACEPPSQVHARTPSAPVFKPAGCGLWVGTHDGQPHVLLPVSRVAELLAGLPVDALSPFQQHALQLGGCPSMTGESGTSAKTDSTHRRGEAFTPYTTSIDYKSGRTLRSYQVAGLNWLLSRWHSRTNAILADEMGLGKTAQTVCFMEHLHRVHGLQGLFLVVVPLSTLQHWRRELETWTNLTVCVYHDSAAGRAVIRAWEWVPPGRPSSPPRFMVLLTTYEVAVADMSLLARFPWEAIVVDEGHRLRGAASKLKSSLNVRPLGPVACLLVMRMWLSCSDSVPNFGCSSRVPHCKTACKSSGHC